MQANTLLRPRRAIGPLNDHDREFLLNELRAAVLRSRMHVVDLTSVGIALKSGMIDRHEAVGWLREIGVRIVSVDDVRAAS